MYVFENPVLQRELLVNLRTNRAFLLLAMYQVLLAVVVLVAWPTAERLDLTSNPPSATKLVNLFFLGQYVIASLMAPSFAAGTITGEKERVTYEMLLASPMRPGAIVLGKMVASLTHLGMLILASLPIIVLCLPLGGVSLYEVLGGVPGFDRVGHSVWRDRRALQQLLFADSQFAGGQLPGDPAVGDHGGDVLAFVGRRWRITAEAGGVGAAGVRAVGGHPDVRRGGRTDAVSARCRQRRQGGDRPGERSGRGGGSGDPTRSVPRPDCSRLPRNRN